MGLEDVNEDYYYYHIIQSDSLDNEEAWVGIDNRLSLTPPPPPRSESKFPRLGFRLSYLDFFIEASGGEEALQGLTTMDVCDLFIKPWTRETQSSYCEWLRMQGHPAVGEANVFISHAWQCCFLDVMDAIVTHMKERSSIKNHDPIVWFCLFSNNQHKMATHDFEWFNNTFKSAVGEIGHTVMVLSPWNNPLPFTRAWCIWEVYSSAAHQCAFEVAMSKTDCLKFLSDITLDTENAIKKMLATVQAEKSQCYHEADRERIFDVIRKTVGFAKINSMVFEQFRSWAIKTCTEGMLQSMATLGLMYQGQGNYDRAEGFLDDCVDSATSYLGVDHPHTLKYANSLACLYMDQGRYRKANFLVQMCLARRRETLGYDHLDTLISTDTQARLHSALGEYKAAQLLLELSLSTRRALLGKAHPSTLSSVNRLGALCTKMKEYRKARRLLEDCCEMRKSVLGLNHPDTLTSISNLAVLYRRLGDYQKAAALAEQCYWKRVEILGEDHPDTLTSENNVASLRAKRGDYKDAKVHFIKCCKKRESVLGEHHPDTQASIENLEVLSTCLLQGHGDTGSVHSGMSSEDDGFDNLSYRSRSPPAEIFCRDSSSKRRTKPTASVESGKMVSFRNVPDRREYGDDVQGGLISLLASFFQVSR